MSTKNEIQQHYLTAHNLLGSRKDAVDKELFDQQHAQVWTDCDNELKARKEELEIKPSLFPEEEMELKELKRLFPVIPPSRDLKKEIDELKARITELENATASRI